MRKLHLTSLFLMTLLALNSFCSAQQIDHIFQKYSDAPLDTTTFTQTQLLSPTNISDWDSYLLNPGNPFPQTKDLRFPFIYRLAAGIIQGPADKPFNAPNYGLGIPPPPQFIHHQNITEYELALERIHQYTVGNE